MISRIKKILNTDIVISEKYKKNIIKILKSNIFIFFVLGLIVSIIEWNHINWYNNYYLEDSIGRINFIYSTIAFMLLHNFMPFFVSIALNLIIKFSKNKIAKKVFKIIMIITNVLSVIYLLLWAWIIAFFELPPQS